MNHMMKFVTLLSKGMSICGNGKERIYGGPMQSFE